jgi:hypothetical protein
VAAAQKLQAAEKDAVDASTKRSHDEGAVSLNANQVLMHSGWTEDQFTVTSSAGIRMISAYHAGKCVQQVKI